MFVYRFIPTPVPTFLLPSTHVYLPAVWQISVASNVDARRCTNCSAVEEGNGSLVESVDGFLSGIILKISNILFDDRLLMKCFEDNLSLLRKAVVLQTVHLFIDLQQMPRKP